MPMPSWRQLYGLDLCPAFLDWLIQENAEKKLLSIAKVDDEIKAGGDELSSWDKDRGDALFLKPNAEALSCSPFADVGIYINLSLHVR